MLNIQKAVFLSWLLLGGIGLTHAESTKSAKQDTNIESITIVKSQNDDRQYSALQLENGIQVVLISDPSLENAAASLAVGVGSAQDPANQMGLAHYLEHMLFLGTEKYPEPSGFMKYTQANGGMTNAFTAYDKTNYMFQINAAKLDEALDRFSDYFKKPTFDPHYSDKERNAVNNEWSLQKAQDGWNLFALEGVTANPDSPAAKFNIGNLDTLKDKPGSELQTALKDFYQTYYSSNIMKLTLVGKQSLPELKALAIKHFSAVPNRNVKLPEITVPGLTKTQMGKAIHYKSIKDMKVLFIDFPIQSTHKDWRSKPDAYIHQLLTSEEPGTVCKELRNLGLAKNVTAQIDSENYGADGYLRVMVDLTDAGLQQQDKIIAAIFTYVDLIRKKGINKSYYTEFKTIAEKNFNHGPKPQPLNQAVDMSMAQFKYPVAHLLNSDYYYGKYNPGAIKKLAKQLDKKRARIWYVSPDEKVDQKIPFFDGSYRTENLTSADFKRWDKIGKEFKFNLPPLNDLLSNDSAAIVSNTYKKPQQILSQPGVEAFLVHSQHYHQEGNAAIDLQINVKFVQDSIRNRTMSYLLNDIYNKQTMSLVDKASRVSLNISSSINAGHSQDIYISGYSAKLSLLLEKMVTEYVNLNISSEAFNQAIDSFQQSMENKRKDHVFRQALSQLGRLISVVQFTDEEYLATSKTITLDEIKAYHASLIKNALVRLLVVGNYTDAQVKEMALAAHKKLPGNTVPEERAINRYALPVTGKPVLFRDDVALADSTVLQAWFAGAKSDEQQAQLEVFDAIFGNAFFTQLRTNEQLGYVVFSSQYPVDDVPGFIMLVQSSNTDLTGIKTRMDKFRKDYQKQLDALTEQEVTAAREAIIANILQKPVDFYQEANWYREEFISGKYSFDKRDRMVAALKKVTKADLVKIYQSLLFKDQSAYTEVQVRGTNFKDKPFAGDK